MKNSKRIEDTEIPIGTRVKHNSVLDTEGEIIGGYNDGDYEYELIKFDKPNPLSWNGANEEIYSYMQYFPEFINLPFVSAIMPSWLETI